MENILGWILVCALIALPVLFVWAGVKLYKRTKLKQEQRTREHAERKVAADNWWKEKQKGATHVGKTKYDYITDTKRTTVTEKETGKQISYVHERDDGPDLLTTMIVADLLFNNKDSSSGKVSWKGDTPTVTESNTSSWGLDDSDSRRSASSSFSSSDSSDSWGSSSSSDSGPSSDW